MERWNIHVGDCQLELKKIEPESVQTVVTSPPYWGLRDYQRKNQIGLEETPEAYASHLVEVFRKIKRVLRDDGTVWLNLGDSYCSSRPMGTSGNENVGGKRYAEAKDAWDFGRTGATSVTGDNSFRGRGKVVAGLKQKDLVGIPWRVAFALQADGWYLRQDIIWHKPNPMPESVQDRCTKAHEYIFLLSKNQKYYYDVEAIKEDGHECRKNKRSVWTVNLKPFKQAHFATYPEKLVEPCILAGTSEKGVCAKCGKPWERIVEASGGTIGQGWHDHANDLIRGMRDNSKGKSTDGTYKRQHKGWQSTCNCNADIVPATVLDPFVGSGTTLAVAQRLGRKGVGTDLNKDYLTLAEQRLRSVTLPMDLS